MFVWEGGGGVELVRFAEQIGIFELSSRSGQQRIDRELSFRWWRGPYKLRLREAFGKSRPSLSLDHMHRRWGLEVKVFNVSLPMRSAESTCNLAPWLSVMCRTNGGRCSPVSATPLTTRKHKKKPFCRVSGTTIDLNCFFDPNTTMCITLCRQHFHFLISDIFHGSLCV